MKPTIQATEFDCAYLAGLIDGEAHIEITHGRSAGSEYLQVTIGNRSSEMLHWCRDRFGGLICPLTYKKPGNPEYEPMKRWKVQGPTAASALKRCLPYLVAKIPQADDAIEFQSTFGPPGQRITEAVRQKRHELSSRLRQRTKRGPRSTNAGTNRAAAFHSNRSKPQRQSEPLGCQLTFELDEDLE